MKVAIITGSYPPQVCGVSDYTERLEHHLRAKGVDVHIYTDKKWGLAHSLKNQFDLGKLSADILHMQYPSTGYGWRLGPQALAILRPMVLTIHEASQAHLLRRLSLYPFALRSRNIIFTNEYELTYACRYSPWIKDRSSLIPIGSNVSTATELRDRPNHTVTYFGLIRPDKGLEQVIELAKLLKSKHPQWVVRVIGKLMPGHEDFHERLCSQTKELNVDWQIGLNGDALSMTLMASDVAYLPFPDGASERRSSLIALLANGAAVVTTRGPHTPSALENSALFATSPLQALAHIEALYADLAKKHALQEEARRYARKFEWEEIANQHIAIYERLLEIPNSRI